MKKNGLLFTVNDRFGQVSLEAFAINFSNLAFAFLLSFPINPLSVGFIFFGSYVLTKI